MGYKDIDEYLTDHPMPEVWPENNLYRNLFQKDSGYISYWRSWRELPDNKLHLIKIYTYA